MAWVTASQIVSDALGMLLGILVLALAASGERSGTRRALAWVSAASVAGVMTGVRLVNVMMMGPLLWKAWRARGERWWGSPPPLLIGSAFLAGIVPWAVWLVSRGGGDYVHGAAY